MMNDTAISLLEFNRRVNRLLHDVSVQQCWVIAETSDVMVRNHCYLELVQKNPETGATVAKARAVVWAGRFASLRRSFEDATGQAFGNGMKVMVEVSANFHEQYGFSLVITNIDPSYTLGDMARQRMEILNRLKKEGIIDLNKSLEWIPVPQRIAVISAGTAAGYGDFMNQLHGNPYGIKFYTCLFPAMMQGAGTVPSVIAALDRICRHMELFDCVVIIRGGGATSELNAFDNYELAANVAQFPLPVIAGIGHDRDRTVIDEVANVRVKTPTAAAEWLLARGVDALGALNALSESVVDAATQILSDARRQVDYYGNTIPLLAGNIMVRHKSRLQNYMGMLPVYANSRISAAAKELDVVSCAVAQAARLCMEREESRVKYLEMQVGLLSPRHVLKRGYSLTMCGGKVVTDASSLRGGERIVTHLASGKIVSEVKKAD